MRYLVALLLAFGLRAEAQTVTSVLIAPRGAIIRPNTAGQAFTSSCTYSDNSTDNCSKGGGVTWASSWQARLQVSSSGVATSTYDDGSHHRDNNAFIVANIGGVTDKAGIIIQSPSDTYYLYMTPDYHKFSDQQLTAVVGSRISLGAAYDEDPDGGHNGVTLQKQCTMSSSNPAVMTVDQDMRATAISVGTARITCNLAGNGQFGSSTQAGWQNPGNFVDVHVTAGGAGNTTWYVRSDGGTPAQCDGQANVAYSSGVTHCAYGQAVYMWQNQATGQIGWRMAGGDKLVLGPTASGWTWGYVSSAVSGGACTADYSCQPPQIPSGSAGHLTQILGANYASCSADSAKTKLNLTFGSIGFNTRNTQFLQLGCMEITDTAACSELSSFNHHCVATDTYGHDGILEEGTTDYIAKDLYIHGLAGENIYGPVGPDTWIDESRLAGTPQTGIDMDGNGWSLSNITGAAGFRLTNTITEHQGCVEEYPITHNIPELECRDQGENGNTPDGLGTASTSGDWYFDHDIWRYNWQDGLDLLHSGMRTLVVTNSQSYGNDGQSYKIGSSSLGMTFANNGSLANCQRLGQPIGDEPTAAFAANPTITPYTTAGTVANQSGDLILHFPAGYATLGGGLATSSTSIAATGVTLPANSTGYVSMNKTSGNYVVSSSSPDTTQAYLMASFVTGANYINTDVNSGWHPLNGVVTLCRAGGDQVVISLSKDGKTRFQNNTIVGYGSTVIDEIPESGILTVVNSDTAMTGNIFAGLQDSVYGYDSGQLPGLFYTDNFSNIPPRSGWNVRAYNTFYNMRNGCIADLQSTETCAFPGITSLPSNGSMSDETVLDNFNFALLSTSPAKGTGGTPYAATDITGATWTTPADMGACAYNGSCFKAASYGPNTTSTSTPTTPAITGETVSLNPASITVGATSTLSCTDSNGTAAVSPTFTPSNSNVTISGSTATGAAAGSVSITCTASGFTSPAKTLTVTAAATPPATGNTTTAPVSVFGVTLYGVSVR